ncbi:ATP-binding protein [Rhizobium paknamense]|uniref:histidine kinase n=1 Tax=Rhizobium paknamense TaxID=1206817 RepID=A0ABU0IL43_9HYPH|nr:ATP-binding protein [Rhizobium paknamense]MDQ0458120.1 PAS domain S-box-containing protein [Rhizobium paknamense]
MPAVQYPFIDIAVHGKVRARFARGEALVLFSADMERVLWANGAGASFFGAASIYDFLDQPPPQQDVTFRQIAATARHLKQEGETRTLMVRVGSGFRRLPLQAHLETLTISPGEIGILFALPFSHADDKARARAMLSGFGDPDTHMALLDGEGGIVSASEHFARLGISPQTAAMLVRMVSADDDGLMKRPIPTAKGYLPAAIGKLSDEPALFLVFAVETILGMLDPSDGFNAAPQPAPMPPAADSPLTALAEAQSAVEAPEEEAPSPEQPVAESFDDVVDALGGITDIEPEPEITSVETPEPLADEAAEEEPLSQAQDSAAIEADQPEIADTVSHETNDEAATEEPEMAGILEPEAEPEQPVVTEEAAPQETEAPAAAEVAPEQAPQQHAEAMDEPVFTFEPSQRAQRFVWKIDALGRFSDVSPEFARAVGPRAAAIEGQAFGDLAALFNLDPDGKIAELLKRRDTWSGRTIYWPVEGTRLKVPVDLAALPTYTRNRDFDGFRGFGVVRLADAVEDPDGVGMTFLPEGEEAASERQDDAQETTPFDFAGDDEAETEEVSLEATGPDATEADPVEEEEHEDTPQPEAPVAEAPERTEPPALSLTETAARRLSDKVIQLEERRFRGRDGLSNSEQAAFREIARKLDAMGIPPRPERLDEMPESEMPEKAEADPSPIDASPETDIEDSTDKALPPVHEAAETEAEQHRAETEADAAAAAPETDTTQPEGAADEPSEGAVLAFPRSRRDVSFTPDVLDMLPVALLAHRGDRLIHANPEFFALTGYETLEALQAAGGLDALLQRDDLAATEGEAGSLVIVRADDELVPVSARLQSIRWEEASALLLALVRTNAVTEAAPAPQKPEEAASHEIAALSVEVEELRSILETATDGVVTLGADGDIRSINRAASALFNYDEEDIRGKPFVTLFAHESQRSILDYLNGLTGHGVASVLNDGREVIGRESSGGFIPLFMTIGRLSSSNGFCAVIRDITQWKRTEEELRNAKRAAETANAHKSDFLARVSHEIRTPLNAIIGFSDIMADERFGPIGHSRYAEYAADIGRSGRHVLDIVNDLLDISKIEAGEMDLDFVAVGLNETVSEAVAIVQPQANNQRVIIRTALSQSVPNVVADLRSVKQIVLNILANAIRFTPSGGQIIVSTAYEPNGSVTLRIRDTGIGMTRSELEQAMKPFRQVSPGGTRLRGDGTGLGLPLTKAMVDANRASFAIHSTPNEGTLVEISFPSPRVLAG